MKRTDLYGELVEILEHEPVDDSTVLDESTNWDSVAVVMVISALDDHGVRADGEAIFQCKTAGELATLVGAI